MSQETFTGVKREYERTAFLLYLPHSSCASYDPLHSISLSLGPKQNVPSIRSATRDQFFQFRKLTPISGSLVLLPTQHKYRHDKLLTNNVVVLVDELRGALNSHECRVDVGWVPIGSGISRLRLRATDTWQSWHLRESCTALWCLHSFTVFF